MSKGSRLLAAAESAYKPSNYTPTMIKPVRQVVSGGGTWFANGRVERYADGSPLLTASGADVTDSSAGARGVHFRAGASNGSTVRV